MAVKCRFEGWQVFGAHVRPKDTRTVSDLKDTIKDFINKKPELKVFTEVLKSMNPKHLGLVADTLELASKHDLIFGNDIDMNKVVPSAGKSLLQHLLSVYPYASKENPESIKLAQEVINNTDILNSKYFLAALNGIFTLPQEASEHLKAVKPLVKDFAQETLRGGFIGTLEKQEKFAHLVGGLVSSNVNPENIKVLPQVKENFKRAGKTLDIVDFAKNNVNLK